jgi:hypothetical protein
VLTFYVYSFSHFGLRMRHMWGIFGVVLALWNVTQHERSLARARASVA